MDLNRDLENFMVEFLDNVLPVGLSKVGGYRGREGCGKEGGDDEENGGGHHRDAQARHHPLLQV